MISESLAIGYHESLCRYLDEDGELVVLRLDPGGLILASNGGFRRLVKLEKFLGKPELANYLADGEVPRFAGLRPGESRPLSLHFLLPGGVVQSIRGMLYGGEREVLFLGERDMLSGGEVMAKISGFNAELTNLNRKLQKKNTEIARANALITELMNKDELTGIANRRNFMDTLPKAISFARRHGHPLALVMADIDHFKAINDRFGHDEGDRVLRRFARILADSCRQEDLPTRFGGEEFILLLPGTTEKSARAFAERIREAVQDDVVLVSDHPLTASFGVTTLAADDTPETLIKRADIALYEAKRYGRNRVVVWTEAPAA